MLQQLKSVYWLMMDSSGKMDFANETLWDEITDLDQNSGDYQEVVVEIYFTDGRFIKLHNRSFESLIIIPIPVMTFNYCRWMMKNFSMQQ